MQKVKQKFVDLNAYYTSFMGKWGWCTDEKALMIIDCIDEIQQKKEFPICVEIGIYTGQSCLPVLLALKEINRGIMYCVDPWENGEASKGYENTGELGGNHYTFWNKVNFERVEKIWNRMIDENGLRNYAHMIRMTSDDIDPIQNIDYLHIDGQHTEQAIRDVDKFASCVNINGYCIVDDITWDSTMATVPDKMKEYGFEAIAPIGDGLLMKRLTK